MSIVQSGVFSSQGPPSVRCNKLHEREEIYEVATKFYEDLYRNINPYQGINNGNKISREDRNEHGRKVAKNNKQRTVRSN